MSDQGLLCLPYIQQDSSAGSRMDYSRLSFISNSKGLSEILRDIHTSTYQICGTEENITRTTTFNKYMCNWTLEVRGILEILWKRGEIAPSPLFHNIFYLLLDFHV